MKCAVSAVLLLSVIVPAKVYGVGVVQEIWKVLKVEHKTQYSSQKEELIYSKPEYVANKNEVQHNSAHEIQRINGLKRTAVPSLGSLGDFSDDIPSEINWVKRGAVTPVKDQYKEYCASGWAFSATGAIEGQYFVQKKRQINSLSAQELVDCSTFYGNEGCVNGTAERAFAYIAGRGGIASEKSYPYYPTQGQCRFLSAYSNITVSGVVTEHMMDEQKLQSWVALFGPVSVAIYSSLDSFKHYIGGVYYHKDCSSVTPKKLDHEVLVVGYGTVQPGGDYWLIKNSWGKDWGDKGFMRLARNRGNHCGIGMRVSYPLLP